MIACLSHRCYDCTTVFVFLIKGIVLIQLGYFDVAICVDDTKADLSFYATVIKAALWSSCL